jgi:DNA-binding transcriptional LysR family regulator
MELRHLRYFAAVADELHFGRAAQRLRIAQPPLSQQIRHLEDELGVALFHRTKRRVALTEAGQAFLARVRVILATAGDAVTEAQRVARGELGRVVIGFMSAAMLDQFPVILRGFRRGFPDAEVQLAQMPSNEQLKAVASGHIDVGFVDISHRTPIVMVGDTAVRVERAWSEALLVALPPDHALARRNAVALADLATEPFVTLPRQPATGFYDQIIGLCQAAGFSPTVRQEASQLPAMLTLVAAGLGVAIVPCCVCPQWRDQIAFRPLAEPASIDVTMIWRTDDVSPVLAAFRDAVHRESRDATLADSMQAAE